MKRVPIVIVGAGVSGRLAKVLRPDARLYEAAEEGKQRIAAMAGTNYLHEDVPELNTRPITVKTGYIDGVEVCPKYEYGTVSDHLKPLDPVAMCQYKHKCRGQKMSAAEATLYAEARTGRYDFVKDAYAYDIPDVQVAWGHFAIEVRPKSRSITLINGEQATFQVEYEKLVWTGPFNGLFNAMGFDPATLKLVSRPLWYRSKTIQQPPGSDPLSHDVIVRYIPQPETPICRRTYYQGVNSITIVDESMVEVQGFTKFTPGKIECNDLVNEIRDMVEGNGIVLAGRFASWDPDELIHHTAAKLRRVLL